MPTIEVNISDFESLLEEKIDREKLEKLLEKVKGEVKDFSPETDLTKIELNDTNRPDLWTPEGIVRQIRPQSQLWTKTYPFFDASMKAENTVEISKDLASIRPYLAACISRGVPVSEAMLTQLIQAQEKLSDTFGRKRQTVSIGLYRLKKITFPVRYELVDPETTSFVPLGFEAPMSLKKIITEHPKGIEYAGTLAGTDRYPILVDAKDEILSFPPIINSRTIGEIEVGDTELFVEVTGTDLRMVVLAVNIFAANLADRGATIEPVVLNYAQTTDFGSTFQTPYDLSESLVLELSELNRVLGEQFKLEEALETLRAYGLIVRSDVEKMTVSAPPYRDDMMHPIDVVEDFAISRGYTAFTPEMPSTFTVGSLSRIEQFSDRLRDAMIGFGFEEIISNILGSSEDFIEKMRLREGDSSYSLGKDIIEIENPMTERHCLLRSWLLPSLLRVESTSSKAYYPHRLFEAGEIARQRVDIATQSETCIHLAALIAHPSANFSELHAILEALFYRLSTKYQLMPSTHPSFIDGRAGQIKCQDEEMGWIGEIHPEVLDAWQIGMPSVAFEIEIEKL